MTTAPARAVPGVFSRNLRAALMAAASGGLLVALAPNATAASCTGSDNVNDTCVIVLGDLPLIHDGKGNNAAAPGGDTLQFNLGAAASLNSTQFGTGTGTLATNFVNFEFAEVIGAGTDLTISSAANDTPTNIGGWTIGVDAFLRVSGAGGNVIGDSASVAVNGTFDVLKSETIGALSGSGTILLAAGQELSANGSTATTAGDITGTTFSGSMQGAGGFAKVGVGMLKLTGLSSFSGPLTVSEGTLEIGNANALSALTGGITISGGELTSKGIPNYTINTAVTINTPELSNAPSRLTGNAIIDGNVSSNGGLQPGNTSVPPGGGTIGNPGQDMGAIHIKKDYAATGINAYVGMFIDIDAALAVNTAAGTPIDPNLTGSFISPQANGTPGTTHDFLNIDGNVSGSTLFALASFLSAPVGGATTGNGIQVIRIAGTNSGNDFFQGSTMVAGPYQYLLRYVKDYNGGTDDGYFLQSAMRDELVVHPALLSAGQALVRHCFRDDQRIPDSPKGATFGRGWVGYRQGSTSFGSDTGIKMDEDFSCTTGGMDWRMGNGWFGGVSGGLGSIDGDLTTPAGVGKLDGRARVAEVYAAFTSSAFFFNLSGGYADMDWTYTGALRTLGGAPTATSSGFIGAAQAGLALGLEPVAVRLVGTVSYDGTDCGSDCFKLNVAESTGLLEGKASLRFDGVTWGGSFRPWAAVSYSSVLSDGINKVLKGPFSVAADTNDALLSIDAGMQTYLDQNFALVLDGGYHESLQKDITGYRAGVALKLYW